MIDRMRTSGGSRTLGRPREPQKAFCCHQHRLCVVSSAPSNYSAQVSTAVPRWAVDARAAGGRHDPRHCRRGGCGDHPGNPLIKLWGDGRWCGCRRRRAG